MAVSAELARTACCEASLEAMPVFSDSSFPTGGGLHESFRPSCSVHELTLNTRAVKILRSLGIASIGQLLTTPKSLLSDQWSFGPTTLNLIHRELRGFLLGAGPDTPPDLSSFESLTESLVRLADYDDRDRDILRKRLGCTPAGVVSLGKLGRQYGLTRERIRQIEEAGLEEMALRARRQAYQEFWQGVLGVVGGPRSARGIQEVGQDLARKYGWPTAPQVVTLGKILRLGPQLHVDSDRQTVSRW